MTGKISEIFKSFQGEGLYVGERQLFVRFFGCNLNCRYCDTKLDHFREYNIEELCVEINRLGGGCHSISFTGGEPLTQKDFLKEVMASTKKNGFRNYLETNGSLPDALKEVVEHVDIIAMDFKLPGSTGMKDFWKEHKRFLEVAKEKEVFVKAVISTSTAEADFKDAISLINQSNAAPVLVLQPDASDKSGDLAEKIHRFRQIAEENNVTSCVLSQLHKIIGAR